MLTSVTSGSVVPRTLRLGEAVVALTMLINSSFDGFMVRLAARLDTESGSTTPSRPRLVPSTATFSPKNEQTPRRGNVAEV